MSIQDRLFSKKGSRLALALLINIAFLTVMLTCFAPIYETNDDVLMSKFVDGQLSQKTAFVPFINITLGWVLKMLYTVGGDGFNWYSASQYLALCLSFSTITWILLRKFRLGPALCMTAAILMTFGADCYLSMNFSKPSVAATVAGLGLMLYALDNESGRTLRLPLVIGMILGLVGYVWRIETFFISAAIMAGIGVYRLIVIAKDRSIVGIRRKTVQMLRYFAPFAVLLLLVAVLLGMDVLLRLSPDIADYSKFDFQRSLLIDYDIPDYEQMPEVYDELNIDENFIYLMQKWSFYDTELFTLDNINAMIDGRAEYVSNKSLGECLGIFLNMCLKSYFVDRPIGGFLLIAALWLAAGKRRAWEDIAPAVYILALFFVIYIYFIYSGRYLANRVDIGLFLAMALSLCFMMDGEKLKEEKLTILALVLLSLFIGYRSCRSMCRLDSHNTINDKLSEKAAIQTIVDDTEHLYFVKVWSIDHEMYGPLEIPPKHYADRIIHIGGWSMHHPLIENILNEYEIENPYRDIVDREDVYIIDEGIDRTLAHIRKYYFPEARAELAEPLSENTNLKIYRILKE